MARLEIPTKGRARFTTALMLWCSGFVFFMIARQHRADLNSSSSELSLPRRLQRDTDERPVMYTFYSYLRENRRTTGMTDDADRHLLEAWRQSWSAAGWEPRILDISDAMQHRSYEKYDEVLFDNVDNDYDRLCYLRWLAMAAVGGGWMSDYDVLPLPTDKRQIFRLPNNGRLTLHEYTADGGVPSLVSGSAREWDRVAHLLLEKSFDPEVRSDMFALLWYHEHDPDTYDVANKVVKGHVPLSKAVTGQALCDRFRSFTAIHFSHAAIRAGVASGLLEAGMGPAMRAQVGLEWIKEWITLCGVQE